MADDDDLGLDGDDAGGAAPAKKRGGGGFLPKLLMIAALVVGAIILIVTIVIITMKLVGGNTTQQAVVPVTEEYSTKRELLDWYSSLGSIRTKTNDQEPATVTVDVVLGYKKEDKATSTEITQRTIELKDFLRRYFTQKSADELAPQNEENLKIEIRNAINDSILSSSKIKDVRFMQLDVIKQ
ncbi:MAG: flagellar basal body-associated FliL family protein [Treponema sp.]|nr:flagellar basal body-associated FliL family protein [Treponema sp.]MBR4463139.1 flagellar basal body-associated FliL family protein [Treponema sp.]